jgi:hypothetical protein
LRILLRSWTSLNCWLFRVMAHLLSGKLS